MAKNRNSRKEPQRAIARRELPTHEEIAALAFCLWEEGGCRENHADADWARAEQILCQGGARAGGGLASSGDAPSVSLASAGGLAS